MLYTPIIDNPNKFGSKRVVLPPCSSLEQAAKERKLYIDENFLDGSVVATKSKNDAITAVAIDRLKECKEVKQGLFS